VRIVSRVTDLCAWRSIARAAMAGTTGEAQLPIIYDTTAIRPETDAFLEQVLPVDVYEQGVAFQFVACSPFPGSAECSATAGRSRNRQESIPVAAAILSRRTAM